MPDDRPNPAPDSYRTGFRDGYRDGFGDGLAARPPETPGKKAGDPAEDEPKADDGAAGEGGGEKKNDDGPKKRGEGKRPDDQQPEDGKPLYKRPLLVGAVLLALLLAIIAAIVFWRHSRHHEKTDDAFIDGRASSVAAQAAGRVTRLLVIDNQAVHAGDLLVEIDSRDALASAAQARAQLADAQSQLEAARAQVEMRRASLAQSAAQTRQSQAELEKAERDAARFRNVDPDAVARQQADDAATQLRSARAQRDAAQATERSARAQIGGSQAQVRTAQAGIEAARAQVDAAELQLSYTRVVAPVDGRVTRRSIEVGNVIAAGQALMSIVGESLWVTANYKETQLTRMQPGQAVVVTVDAFPDTQFNAHVDSIQRGTGAYFSLLPAENATGNYVKVVQRVPVKIVFDDGSQLRRFAIGPGMSVTPDVQLP